MTTSPSSDPDVLRAARHEAGHWLAYWKYGFKGGTITKKAGANQFGAEIIYTTPNRDRASQRDFFRRRMLTLVAGFAAESVARHDKRPLGYKPATAWSSTDARYAGDDAKIEQLMAAVARHISKSNSKSQHIDAFIPQANSFLATEVSALDPIQDAVLAAVHDLQPDDIKKLPSVSDFLFRL